MYKLTENPDVIIRLEDGANIPRGHRWFDDFEEWVAAGNTPKPADKPPVVYITVSPRQIRQALTRLSLRDQLEAAVVVGGQEIKDWWEFSTAVEENHPMVVLMATSLGVSDEDRHSIFELAQSL